MAWFLQTTDQKININRDLWDDPALFINGKTSASINEFDDGSNFGNLLNSSLPFLTEIQTVEGQPIQTVNESFRLYELEPKYTKEDYGKPLILRMVGAVTGNLYIFINVKVDVNQGSKFGFTQNSVVRDEESARNSFFSGIFASCAGSTLGLIIMDTAFNFVDPLSIGTDISNFVQYNNQPDIEEESSERIKFLLPDESKIVDTIEIGYFNNIFTGSDLDKDRNLKNNVSKKGVPALNNIPLPRANTIPIPLYSELTSDVVKERVDSRDENFRKKKPAGGNSANQLTDAPATNPNARITQRKERQPRTATQGATDQAVEIIESANLGIKLPTKAERDQAANVADDLINFNN